MNHKKRAGGMKGLKTSAVLAAALAASAAAFASSANLQEARPAPEWFTRGVMYQVQPRAFTPEGTLKSIEAKLPYLKDLGVTIVYLVPVFAMDDDMDTSFRSPRQVRSGFGNPKNQYRIKDYFHVEEEYGTDGDLRDLVVVVQNWTDRELSVDVSFAVPPDYVPNHLSIERVDRSVRGVLAVEPLLAKRAERKGATSFRLGPFGYAVYDVVRDGDAALLVHADVGERSLDHIHR